MIKTYAQWVVHWRWVIIFATLASVLLLASGGRFLEFTNNYRVFFGKDNPQLLAFENLQDTYTKNDNVLFMLMPKDGNVFTPRTLQAVVELTEASWQLPYSIRVDSITNFQHTYAEEDDLTVIDLVEDPENLSADELEKIKNIALNEPLLLDRLISPSAHATAVNITVELPEKSLTEVPEAANFAREIRRRFEEKYPEIDFSLTGMVMMNNSFPEASKKDMKTLVPLALLAVIVGLLFFLRSFSGVLATLLVIAFSILAAMGSTGWLGIKLTPPSASAPTIILTLAIADSIHFLVTMLYNMRKGVEKHAAIIESLRINFQPIMLTSITTVVGFLSLNFSDAPPFRDLGNITAMGVIYAWIFSVMFLPAMMAVLPVRVKQSISKTSQVMDRLADFVISNRSKLLWGIGALILLSVAMIPRNELNDVFVEYFDESIEFRRDTDKVAENLTGLYLIHYSLDSKNKGGISEPAFLNKIDAFANWYRQQPEVLHVSIISDTFKRLNKNMHGDDPAMYKLPDQRDLAAQYLLLYEMSLPYGLDLNNQIDIDKTATKITATLKTISTREVIALEERAQQWLQENAPELKVNGASPTVMFAHIGDRNIRSMLKGTSIALVIISLILIFALRSLKLGLLSLIPNLAPVGVAFGVWALTVGQIGLSLSIVAAMTLGIVVDDTVHFLSKYLRARREQGLNAEDAVRYAFHTVGVALWVTTIVLIAGFLVLAQSAFELNAGMGLLTAITIAIALFIDFMFLPPLLIKFEEKVDASIDAKSATTTVRS